MITVKDEGMFLQNGKLVSAKETALSREDGCKKTIAYRIFAKHNT